MRRCGVAGKEGVPGDIQFLLAVLQTNCAVLHLSILDSLAVLPVPRQCSEGGSEFIVKSSTAVRVT